MCDDSSGVTKSGGRDRVVTEVAMTAAEPPQLVHGHSTHAVHQVLTDDRWVVDRTSKFSALPLTLLTRKGVISPLLPHTNMIVLSGEYTSYSAVL